METLAPPPPHEIDTQMPLPPQAGELMLPEAQPMEQSELALESQERSRMQRLGQKIRKIAIGEGAGTAIEAGMMAAGVSLPGREVVGTGIDIKTYGEDSGEGNEIARNPSRMRKVSRAAGLFAINLASGYAMQKGVPALMDIINDNFNNGAVESGVQLVGKMGTMTGATSLINRRFGG